MPDIADVKDRARRREAAGDLEQAVELYLQALRRGTDGRGGSVDPGLCVRVADLYAEMDRSEDALRFYRQGAKLFDEQRLVPNAVAALKKILALDPDDVRAHRQLSELHLEVGHQAEARTHLLRYFERCADSGRAGEARETLERMRDTFPERTFVERAEAYLDAAREKAEALDEEPGREAEAEELADLLAAFDTTSPATAPERRTGTGTDRQGPGPEAGGAASGVAGTPEPEAEPAAVDEPGLHPSLEGVLTELRELGGEGPSSVGERPLTPVPEETTEPSTAAPAEAPDEAALGEQAELRKGLQVLEELLALAPESVDLHRRKLTYARRLDDDDALGDAWVGLGRALSANGSHRAAREAFRRALALAPGKSTALSGLARVDATELEEKKREGETAGSHNRTRRIQDAEQYELRQKLGRKLWSEFEASMRQLPWLDGAAKAFQAAGPEFLPPLEVYELLGRFLMAREKHEEAVEVMELALELEGYEDEPLADLLYHLGLAHEALGEDDAAEECHRRVAAVDGDFAEAWEGGGP